MSVSSSPHSPRILRIAGIGVDSVREARIRSPAPVVMVQGEMRNAMVSPLTKPLMGSVLGVHSAIVPAGYSIPMGASKRAPASVSPSSLRQGTPPAADQQIASSKIPLGTIAVFLGDRQITPMRHSSAM